MKRAINLIERFLSYLDSSQIYQGLKKIKAVNIYLTASIFIPKTGVELSNPGVNYFSLCRSGLLPRYGFASLGFPMEDKRRGQVNLSFLRF